MDLPRQLKLPELQQLFPLDFTIEDVTEVSPKGVSTVKHVVHVPTKWQLQRLVQIEVMPGRHATVHRAAAPVFIEWLRRARLVGADKCIVTVDGGFYARLKRGANVPATEAGLSRHARGIAIDLNAHDNMQGHAPAPLDAIGTLLPLVPIAYDLDIVWGGDWHGSSCDPMHFEIGHSH